MTSPPTDDLLAREEAKRNSCWDPRQRWLAFQRAVDWAEQVVKRNTPARCRELERAKLARLAASEPPGRPGGD